MTEKKLLLPATPEGLRTLAKLVGQHMPHATLTGAKVTNLDPLRIIEDGDSTDSPIEDYSTFPDRIDQPAIVLRQGQRRLLVPMTGDIRALTEDVSQIKDTTDQVVVDVGVTDLAVEQVTEDVAGMETTLENLQGRLDTAFDNVVQVGVDAAAAVVAAEAAQSTANGATAIITGTSSSPPATRKNGSPVQANDLYYQLTGDSPPRLMNILQRNTANSGWHIQRIMAASIFVPGSITGILLEDDAITARTVNVLNLQAALVTSQAISGKTITGSVIRTSASGRRMMLNADETEPALSGYFQNGTKALTFDIRPSPSGQFPILALWEEGSTSPAGETTLTPGSVKVGDGVNSMSLQGASYGGFIYSPKNIRIQATEVYVNGARLDTLPALVAAGTAKSGTGTLAQQNIAAYDVALAYVALSGLSGPPSVCVPVMTNGPSGSAALVPRFVSSTASTATFRFYNTSPAAMNMSGPLTFSVLYIA